MTNLWDELAQKFAPVKKRRWQYQTLIHPYSFGVGAHLKGTMLRLTLGKRTIYLGKFS